MAGILAAHAHRAGAADLALQNERARRVTLRLLAVSSASRPGALGPRPISNDRRPCRHRQVPSSPVPSGAESLEALSAILPALAAAISGALPAPAEPLPGFTADQLRALLTEASARRLARNLAALESHPRIGELAGALKRDWNIAHAAIAALTTLAQADASHEPATADTLKLVETVRDFYTFAERCFELGLALAAHGRRADVYAALERFLDGRAGKQADARRPAA